MEFIAILLPVPESIFPLFETITLPEFISTLFAVITVPSICTVLLLFVAYKPERFLLGFAL